MTSPRVLFIGPDWYGSNARSLADGFRAAGGNVLVVDTTDLNRPRRGSVGHVRQRFFGSASARTVAKIHGDIERAGQAVAPDIVFVYKGIRLDLARLLTDKIDGAIYVHYSADDVSNPENTSADYLATEAAWDAVVTTKRHNVAELKSRGVERVIHVLSAYDPSIHRPTARRAAKQYLLGFIGNRRPDRAALIERLAARYGEEFLLAGPGWSPTIGARTGATQLPAQYGESFSHRVAETVANLVLLNSANRDTHTCRSFEVPAAGGLFVGERTDDHSALLAENDEALFFESEDELHDIIARVRHNQAWALEVAARGSARIRRGNHTYGDRATEILAHLRDS